MLSTEFYRALAAMLAGDSSLPGELFIAIGTGDAAPAREATGLRHEVARRPVDTVEYLDEAGDVSASPTTRVRFAARFAAGDDLGEIRECGLFGGDADQRPGSGTLLSGFAHPSIVVTTATTFERAIVVDLTPRGFVPGAVPTRWLGNASTLEVHDVEHLTGACHERDIRVDHRFYLSDLTEAEELGYDRCAFCFGRDQSER